VGVKKIGRYIVDFINFEKKLIIEVEGGQHSIYRKRDIIRDKYLKKEGYRVLRFWDNEVLNNIEGVLEVIMQNLLSSPQPSPLKGEGKRNNQPNLAEPLLCKGGEDEGYSGSGSSV